MNEEWVVNPEKIDTAELRTAVEQEIKALDTDQLRRFAIDLGVVDRDEIISAPDEKLRERAFGFMDDINEHALASTLRVIQTKIRFAKEAPKN